MPSSPGPEEQPTQDLFAAVRYTIASSLPVPRAEQLRHVLDTNGATYIEKGLLDSTLNTVITNSNRFEGYELVAERGDVRVVSDKWVERSIILGKMQPEQYFSPDPAMVFSGIVASASDLPTTDLEVLSAGITGLGGQWRTGLTRDVTHLFALTPDSAKYSTALHYREETGIRVVLPHWFDDAVRLGMGNLPTKPYEWPDPELLKGADGLISEKESVKAKGRAALAELEQNDVKRNMYATAVIFTPTLGQSSPPAESDISLVLNKVPGPSAGASTLGLKQIQVWNGRKIILSRTLELYKGRREAVQAGIERAGGVVLRFEGDEDEPESFTDQKLSKQERIRRRNEGHRVADCDVLVTRWRHGRAYVRACQGRKIVGNLAWLFHVQSSGVLSNPQDQLLHYPVPKRSIEGFSKHVITVTNYTGEAREYIKKLIAAMGATFTPGMSGENTALIAAYRGGTKAEKAESWSIPVVNHTWLEDCFVQWRNLTMALEKYIVFPSGVNFSSLLGERGVGVGSQVMNEVEELAVMVFEEDEDYVSDHMDGGVVDNPMDVDIPNETEGRAKVIAKGLVDADETEAAGLRPRSKAQSKKFEKKPDDPDVPEGMDIEPSNAAVVSDADRNVGVDSEDNETTKVSGGPKTGTRRVSRQESQEDVEDVSTRKKADARSGGVDDEVDPKTIVKPTRVGQQAEDIIELDSENELPKTKKKGKKGRSRYVMTPDEKEEEEEVAEDEKPSKTTSNSKAKRVSTAGKTRPAGAPSSSKRKAIAVAPVSNSDEGGVPPKSSRKGAAVSSKLNSVAKKYNQEAEDSSEPEQKPKTGLRRKLTVEVVMISPPKGKRKEIQASDDDVDRMQKKMVKPTPVSVAPGAQSEGLLRKAKGDARTRVKRRSIRDGYVESGEEEEAQPKNRRRSKNGKEERKPSKSKSKTQPSVSKSAQTKAPVRSKPLRVYSSEEFESEDETLNEVASAGLDELDGDEDLLETIDVPSGSRAKTRERVQTSAKAMASTRNRKELATPKRTISVLSPSLAMSGGKVKGKKKADDSADELETVRRPGKSKAKVQIPSSGNESSDEDEVKEIINPQSGLTKSNSFKALVGQSSSKDLGQKSKGRRRLSEPRKMSQAGRLPMDVDDDRDSRSSPASVSGPSVTVPRRNAAARAMQRLHDTVMPDVVNYETQLKKAKGKNRQSTASSSAFALDMEEEEQGRDVWKRKKLVYFESDGESQPKKKRRVSNETEDTIKVKRKAKGKQKAKEESIEREGSKPSSGVVLLTTQVTLPDDVVKSLGKLGVSMTTRPTECTHLLCPHLVRTEKFLCALPRAPFILSAKWATASAAAKMLLPEKEFLLKDPAGEQKFDVNLPQALRRAKANKGRLLEGEMFYLTSRVNVDKKLLKNIVNACGGDLTTQPPSVRIVRAAPEHRHVISCKEDISIWRPIAAEGYKIYSPELLLAGIMKQQIEWDREEYMVEA